MVEIKKEKSIKVDLKSKEGLIYIYKKEPEKTYSIASLKQEVILKLLTKSKKDTKFKIKNEDYEVKSSWILEKNLSKILKSKEIWIWLNEIETKLLEDSKLKEKETKTEWEDLTIYNILKTKYEETYSKEKEKVIEDLELIEIDDIFKEESLTKEFLNYLTDTNNSVDYKKLLERIKKEGDKSFFEYCKETTQLLMIVRLFNISKDGKTNVINYKKLEEEYKHLTEIIEFLNKNVKTKDSSINWFISNPLNFLMFLLEVKNQWKIWLTLEEIKHENWKLYQLYLKVLRSAWIDASNLKLKSWKDENKVFSNKLKETLENSFYLPDVEFVNTIQRAFFEFIKQRASEKFDETLTNYKKRYPEATDEDFTEYYNNAVLGKVPSIMLESLIILAEKTQRVTKIYSEEFFDIADLFEIKHTIESCGDSDVSLKHLFEWYKINMKLYKLNKDSVIKELSSKIIWQDYAIDKIWTILNNIQRQGKIVWKPLATMLFLWPTGVGKSELAKLVAKTVFWEDKALIAIPLNQYGDADSAALSNQLTGSQKWYVWSDSGWDLTNKMKENPNRVVLFDELDKIKPEAMDIFMQLLDEGKLYSNKDGDYVDFSNSVVVFTTNFWASLTFTEEFNKLSLEERETRIKQDIVDKGFMKPEVVNRFKDVVVFNKIDVETGKKILNLILKSKIEFTVERTAKKLIFDKKFVDYIFKVWYSEKDWVRELKKKADQTIDKLINDSNFWENLNIWFWINSEGKPFAIPIDLNWKSIKH